MSSIPAVDLIQDEEQTFPEWSDSQEFEYQRVESSVVDYINSIIDFDKLDNAIKSNDSITVANWKDMFERVEIDTNSRESQAAKNHISSYIAVYGSNNNDE